MTSRKIYRTDYDSTSLWNYTLSPGWTNEEAVVLRAAIIKYGCGNWQEIQKHFPNKTNGQLNLQTQRLFGQQSLAEWNKVRVDPITIKRMNDSKPMHLLRKNGCLVNTGDNMTLKERRQRLQENKEKYGLTESEVIALKVPYLNNDIDTSTLDGKWIKYYKLMSLLCKCEEKLRQAGKMDIIESIDNINFNDICNEIKNKNKNKNNKQMQQPQNNENIANHSMTNQFQNMEITQNNNNSNNKNNNNDIEFMEIQNQTLNEINIDTDNETNDDNNLSKKRKKNPCANDQNIEMPAKKKTKIDTNNHNPTNK